MVTGIKSIRKYWAIFWFKDECRVVGSQVPKRLEEACIIRGQDSKGEQYPYWLQLGGG